LIIFISLLFSALIAILVFYILSTLSDSAKEATGQAFDKANTSLADMFMFIDLDKLVMVSLIVIFIFSVVLFLATGSFVIPIVFAVFVSFLPGRILKILKQRRLNDIQQNLPDMLLNTSSSLRAGSGVSQALEVSSREQGGAIAQEFGLLLSELRLGVDMVDALDNLQERVALADMDLLVSAIKISREVGGNLADVLYRLSDTLRKKIEMEGKIKTLTAQGRMQGIVMVCLPIFIGVVMLFMESTGKYTAQLFTTWYGWITLAVLLSMLSLGYFFIKKIVNIDV